MSNNEKRNILTEQIDLRIELLNKVINGDRKDLDIPKSLTKLREWELPKDGVLKIGSPGSFVSTHPFYGDKIIKIRKLLNVLHEDKNSKKKKKKKSKNKMLTEANETIFSLSSSLSGVANQFAQYVKEISSLKEEIALYKGIEDDLNEQVKILEHELETTKKELLTIKKQHLSLKNKLKKGQVTNIDFGKSD